MTMPDIPGDLAMPVDMNGISRCKGLDGVNFGGQCWWIRNCTSGGMSCKYCDVELDKGKEGSVLQPAVPGHPGVSPKRGGWL